MSGGKRPKWNQSFDIEVKDLGAEVIITVFDADGDSTEEVSSNVIAMT